MSGRVVRAGELRHECAPGWHNEYRDGPPFGPGVYAFMPDPREYRKGTVWECDCGRTWVSRGPIAGFIHWRRERRGERRRREKRVGAGP